MDDSSVVTDDDQPIPADEILEIRAHGRSYQIVNPHGLIGRPLAAGRPYEQHLLEEIYREQFTGMALDVGAHVGNHTLYMAAICGLQVMAFEPTHMADLETNLKLNPELEVIPVPFALGARFGAAKLVGKDRFEMTDPGTPEAQALVVPLDMFGLTQCSVIKVDIEDMEPEFLKGALDTLSRCKPVLYLEARDRAHEIAIEKILKPAGYRYQHTVKAATPLVRWEPV